MNNAFFSSCGWDNAKYLIFSNNVFDDLVYYSHFLSALPALLIGLFVFLKNRKLLTAKILFVNTFLFLTWIYFDLILWATEKPEYTMFFWSVIILVEILIYATSLYLVKVFIDNQDLSHKNKIIIFFVFLPLILSLPARYNLTDFDFTNCDRAASEGIFMIYFSYSLEIIFTLCIITFAFLRYKRSETANERKKILLITLGVISFLLTFSLGNIIGSFTENWKIPHYGLFGMPIFVGFLAYLIIRYKTFDIKLLAAEALVITLIIIVSSQFLFVQNLTSQILTGITLVLVSIFGYMLIRSVKVEVQRKEELEQLSSQLAIANDKLHQLDQAKSEFISIASHQLRTPLTSVKGFSSLLLEGTYGPVSEAQRDALEKIYIANERLIQLVEDLLNISRIDAGRMEFNFEETQIEDLIQEVVDTLELSAKAKKLYLHWEKPIKSLPKTKIDITKVKEVISNMVDNAIKYTPKGGITIKAEAGSFFSHLSREQKRVVRVIVSDTGIGMHPSETQMIFQKFQRGRGIGHYHTEGTGLGMYVGKKIVEAHHGRIWAESQGKGKGSRFTLELPAS